MLFSPLKVLRVFRDCGDFLEGFYLYEVVSEYAKSIRRPLNNINVWGEKGKILLPFTENAPINMKLSLSRRIVEQSLSKLRLKHV
jgi:hypothetical protein